MNRDTNTSPTFCYRATAHLSARTDDETTCSPQSPAHVPHICANVYRVNGCEDIAGSAELVALASEACVRATSRVVSAASKLPFSNNSQVTLLTENLANSAGTPLPYSTCTLHDLHMASTTLPMPPLSSAEVLLHLTFARYVHTFQEVLFSVHSVQYFSIFFGKY